MKELFDTVSLRCSSMITSAYSTSFSLGISCLHKDLRNPICAIYGFVRFADEIVDTFHSYDKADLLSRFKEDTHRAIDEGISLNPVLNSFQLTVSRYEIPTELIDQFLLSMEMDLTEKKYNPQEFETYILGSAEVVGLMCLHVFCDTDKDEYERLKPYAMKLGSAFQKINFLRDLQEDYLEMGRSYFPNVELSKFDEKSKLEIEMGIEDDFKEAYIGIKKLPKKARFGVYLAYVYYYSLFKKIRRTHCSKVMSGRIRIANPLKFSMLCTTYLKHRLNLI